MRDRTPSPATASRRATEKALSLDRMTNKELERVFLDGTTPALDTLAGWEFRGLNTPRYFRALGIRKFFKGFYRRNEQVFGYNCPAVQNGLGDPWIARPSDANPKRFGYFEVIPVDPAAVDNKYLHALLLDYGRGSNPRLDPSAGLRDYLVQIDGDGDLLLGKAYYALGRARLPTFSYFVLERHRPALQDIFQ